MQQVDLNSKYNIDYDRNIIQYTLKFNKVHHDANIYSSYKNEHIQNTRYNIQCNIKHIPEIPKYTKTYLIYNINITKYNKSYTPK